MELGHYELVVRLLGKEQLRVVFPEGGGYVVEDPYLSVDVRYVPPEIEKVTINEWKNKEHTAPSSI